MNSEVYRNHAREITINVANSKIESVRRKNITKTGLRVYESGFIGTAGTIGNHISNSSHGDCTNHNDCVEHDECVNHDDSVNREDYKYGPLFDKAKEALKLKIPYNCELSCDKTEKLNLHTAIIEEAQFTAEIEELLSEMHSNNPNYIFSNKIKYEEYEISLANDKGLDLMQKENFISMELTYKEKASADIYDGFIELSSRNYNRAEIIRQCAEICAAQDNIMELPKGKVPVVFSTLDYTLFKKFMLELNGRTFGSHGSLFSEKLGKRVFHPNFSLLQTNNPKDGRYTFFDAEGAINEGYKYPLIDGGIILAPYTDKKTAKHYELPHTGSAISEYDGVPTIGMPGLKIAESDKTTKTLMNGKSGVFVKLAMGGDFKPNGDFATPVQLALVFDGEHFIGRLPQLQIASNVFKMFGEAYIGTGCNKLSPMSDEKCVIMELEVEKL